MTTPIDLLQASLNSKKLLEETEKKDIAEFLASCINNRSAKGPYASEIAFRTRCLPQLEIKNKLSLVSFSILRDLSLLHELFSKLDKLGIIKHHTKLIELHAKVKEAYKYVRNFETKYHVDLLPKQQKPGISLFHSSGAQAMGKKELVYLFQCVAE